MDHLTHVVASLAEQYGVIGYWVAFFAALAETVLVAGLILPGSTFLVLMGAVAGEGYIDLGDLLLFAIAGATLGDNVNYWLGRRYGARWLRSGKWFLKDEHFAKAQGFFERHGGKSVFLGRFIPSVKEVMPFVAGVVGMRQRSFMFWNLLGAVGWGLQWILPGYIFAQSLALAHTWLSRVSFFVAALAITLLLLYGLKWLVYRYGPTGFHFLAPVSRSIALAVRANPNVVQLVERHPRFFAFLQRRFDRSTLQGMPLTLAGLAMGYVVMLFGGLVEDLLTHEAVVAIDARLNDLLSHLRTPPLNDIFYGLTTLGNWPTVVTGLIATIAVLWWLGSRRFILPLLVSVSTAQTLAFIGKYAFQRPRPELALLNLSSFSFPSGHAAISVAFYGFLVFMLLHAFGSWRRRVNLAFAWAWLALLIGLSRLYLGVHYLSDVLGGYLVGALGLLLGIALTYAGTVGTPRRELISRAKSRFLQGKAVVVSLAVVAWVGVLVAENRIRPSELTATTAPQPLSQSIADPASLVSKLGSAYAVNLLGRRVAPINLIFLARDRAQLDQCLQASGWNVPATVAWRSLFSAYYHLVTAKGDNKAPLAPWFWRDHRNDLGYLQLDSPSAVFDRHFLRVWQAGALLTGGVKLFVATTGDERIQRWQLIPQPELAFDAARQRLLHQMTQVGAVQRAETRPTATIVQKTTANASFVYEGGISIITVSTHCMR